MFKRIPQLKKFRYFSAFLVLVSLCGSFRFVSRSNKLEGTVWQMNCIRIDGDTLFLRSDSSFVVKNYFKNYKDHMDSPLDSAAILHLAKERFSLVQKVKIHFISDTKYTMTKMRGGGMIFPNELDSGTYLIRQDSVFLYQNADTSRGTYFTFDDNLRKLTHNLELPNYSSPSGFTFIYYDYVQNQ